MEKILLFDQDTQKYRQSIYKKLASYLKKEGFELKVIYDKNLNSIEDNELFIPLKYRLKEFIRIVDHYNPNIIIQFVWLKYKFLLPFMAYERYIKGRKIITWSKGVNIFKPDQKIKNQLYYIRQKLSNALLLYAEENRKHVKKKYLDKAFIAKNTLNFNEFSPIEQTKNELKNQMGFKGKKIILMVGRLNIHERKPELFIEIEKELITRDYRIVIIGPQMSTDTKTFIKESTSINYLGPIYDEQMVNKYYKMADVFCMPGRIGLALNHAFYYHCPVILENIPQGSEADIFRDGHNGLLFNKSDASDLLNKIDYLLEDDTTYKFFAENARNTVMKYASIEQMFNGFKKAINFVNLSNN